MHKRILNQNFKALGAYLFELCCSEKDIAFVPIYLPHPVVHRIQQYGIEHLLLGTAHEVRYSAA